MPQGSSTVRERIRRVRAPGRITRAQRGREGEGLAVNLLRRLGYHIKATNVRCALGELDIIAREGNTLCFVEVRSVSTGRYGGATASVGVKKQEHIRRAAQWYLKRFRLESEVVRFDVVGIEWRAGAPPHLELVRGAFEHDAW